MQKDTNKYDVKLVKTWSEDEIVDLYKAGGWWKDSYDPSGIASLIKHSFAFAVVVDKANDKAVGMGRVISDSVSDAYIQDMVILPEYRGKGIGKQLLNTLVDYCLSKGIIWIGLIAEPSQDNFYLSSGFKKMKDYVPMKYQQED